MFGRKGVFGRKVAEPQPVERDDPKQHPGHRAVLNHLRQRDVSGDPAARLQVAATALFDGLYFNLAQPEKGTRIEDLLAVLGACGGYACVVAALRILRETNQSVSDAGMMAVDGVDGKRYFFGDLPNTMLLEHPQALLSLALGQAHHMGAPVTLERVHQVMKRTAGAVGGAEFGRIEVAEPHASIFTVEQSVSWGWSQHAELFDVYEVPPRQWASVSGLAVQRAIELGAGVLDPLLAADIVTQFAVPAAKLDPVRMTGEPPVAI